MYLKKLKKIILCVGVILALYGGQGIGRKAIAQSSSSTASAPSESGAAALRLQRSVQIYNYKTTAPSGPQRGEEIYFIKCWYCHNKYTREEPRGRPAPPMQNIYKRPMLATTGKPVNDETLAEKINKGGPAMPAYRYALSDADMADLISYIKSDKCCWEGEEPPHNPWYRY
ncbi:MAG: hypothetical protein A3G20_06890 [Acidobacteria bacterium RIFCSPLOWO2_12_FULL_59_11]|nr:MAG: hypothetical protein A3G20_06890 [Acidobacteria bacterium RIFCSPLOWO2_12_FULL_59_11]